MRIDNDREGGVIALMALLGVKRHRRPLIVAIGLFGAAYLSRRGFQGFLVLGGVFLCVTGAEALYADMGHFGPRPIRLAWSLVVFPALILNYAGQAAIVLAGAPTEGNIFYRLCPAPLIALATLATVIASQSIITGAYSMTRQAIRLGWLPRMNVKQTSEEGYGQIYVGAVNWLLMIVTLALTVGFGKSDNLAAAYGIAVSATMLMTSVLLFIAMREVWNWPVAAAGAVAACFILIDGGFFAANMAKVLQGGWVPLLLASLVYGAMWIWHRGAAAVQMRVEAELIPLSKLIEQLTTDKIARVPGSAVFFTRAKDGTPAVMSWHVRQNRALHQYVLALTMTVVNAPRVNRQDRLTVKREADCFWRAEARLGFMEHPDIPDILSECKEKGAQIDLDDVTFYVGAETIVPAEDGKGLPRWQEALFAFMGRNAARISDYLQLPYEHVVEIGREIEV
jgi:KUP system potassium uptake protein